MGKQSNRRSVRCDGPLVRDLRKEKGWTVDDLAEQAGVSARTVQNLECCHEVDARTARQVADALEVECKAILRPHISDESQKTHVDKPIDSVGVHFFDLIEKLNVFMRSNAFPPEKEYKRENIRLLIVRLKGTATATIAYIAKTQRRKESRDFEEERRLGERWAMIGELIMKIDHADALNLALRAYSKSQYWADIEDWSMEDIEKANIVLKPLASDIETFALRMLNE